VALATASLLTTDADAARQVRHTVNRAASRTVHHFGPANRVVRRKAVTHTASHQTRPNFGRRHQNGTQAHQNPTHQNAGNAQSPQNSHAKLKATTTQAHSGSAQLGLIKNRIAKIENTNLQNTANADLKAGNADIQKATALRTSAAELQAKAKIDAAKGNKTLEASDLGRANADLKQAAKLNNQGQNLVNSGTAEKAVLQKQPTQAQQVQVLQAMTANITQGNADIKQANALRASAAALQAKAKIDAAKGDKAEAASDLGRANAALKQAAQLNSRGDALIKNARAEGAAIEALRNKGNTPSGNTANGSTPGGNTANGSTPGGNTANPNNGNGNTANAGNGNAGNGNNGNGNARNPKNGNPAAGGDNGSVANAGSSSAPAAVQATPGNSAQVASAATTMRAAAPARGATGSFKALSLAWNRNGGWVVRTADALDAANEDAMTTCNGQFGGCQQVMTVDSSAFGCLAVMSDGEHRLFAAKGRSVEAVTASVQHQLESRGQKEGQLVYSGCNNS
jgi:hypothetical protein